MKKGGAIREKRRERVSIVVSVIECVRVIPSQCHMSHVTYITRHI